MAEKVETGGLMSFDNSLKKGGKLSKRQKSEIARGYEEYDERKRSQRVRKWILILLIIVIVVAGGIAIFLSRSS